MSNDTVERPKHYTRGKIECIDFIEDQGFGEGFNRGNAIKYIVRAGKKDPGKEIEDLEKARVYLSFEIDRLKCKEAHGDFDGRMERGTLVTKCSTCDVMYPLPKVSEHRETGSVKIGSHTIELEAVAEHPPGHTYCNQCGLHFQSCICGGVGNGG